MKISNLFKGDTTKVIVGGVLGLVLLFVIYLIIKKLTEKIGDTLTFGLDSAEKKEAVKKQGDRIKNIPINTKKLKYTVASYDRAADMLHQELLRSNGIFNHSADPNIVRGIFRQFVHNVDQYNQLVKSFGIRENMDLKAYLRAVLIPYSLPFSDTMSLGKLNDLMKSRKETAGIQF
jgi:hypothetical protein